MAGSLGPILEQIGSLTERIRDYDRKLEEISKERYPEAELLRQVEGIGPLTALTFVLTLEEAWQGSGPSVCCQSDYHTGMSK